MLRKIKTKKGFQLGAFETFFALAFLFGAAIFFVVLFYAWGQISPELETGLNSALPDNAVDTFNLTQMNSNVTGGVTMLNVIFPFIVLGLLIFALISAFMSNSHPAFLFISIIILAVAILLGAIFSNTFQQLVTGTPLQSASETMGITTLFMKNLPIIIGIIAVSTIVILFAFGRNRGATGGL